jgi:hypothetical protein
MRVFTYDRFKPGVTMEKVTPYLAEEVANVWRLWKADDFPLTKAGLLEWVFVPLTAPLPVESLFRADVDVDEPYDRSVVATKSREAA